MDPWRSNTHKELPVDLKQVSRQTTDSELKEHPPCGPACGHRSQRDSSSWQDTSFHSYNAQCTDAPQQGHPRVLWWCAPRQFLRGKSHQWLRQRTIAPWKAHQPFLLRRRLLLRWSTKHCRQEVRADQGTSKCRQRQQALLWPLSCSPTSSSKREPPSPCFAWSRLGTCLPCATTFQDDNNGVRKNNQHEKAFGHQHNCIPSWNLQRVVITLGNDRMLPLCSFGIAGSLSAQKFLGDALGLVQIGFHEMTASSASVGWRLLNFVDLRVRRFGDALTSSIWGPLDFSKLFCSEFRVTQIRLFQLLFSGWLVSAQCLVTAGVTLISIIVNPGQQNSGLSFGQRSLAGSLVRRLAGSLARRLAWGRSDIRRALLNGDGRRNSTTRHETGSCLQRDRRSWLESRSVLDTRVRRGWLVFFGNSFVLKKFCNPLNHKVDSFILGNFICNCFC